MLSRENVFLRENECLKEWCFGKEKNLGKVDCKVLEKMTADEE